MPGLGSIEPGPAVYILEGAKVEYEDKERRRLPRSERDVGGVLGIRVVLGSI